MRRFITCPPCKVLLELSSEGELDEQGRLHAWERSAYKVLEGKPEGKRPLGRHRHRLEDNIRMGPRGIRWWVDLIHLAQDRGQWQVFVNVAMNLWAS
jgi:hypothetical protein